MPTETVSQWEAYGQALMLTWCQFTPFPKKHTLVIKPWRKQGCTLKSLLLNDNARAFQVFFFQSNNLKPFHLQD